MKESEIQRAILDWLALTGYSAWKMPLGGMKVGGGFSAANKLKGFPDIFGICKYQKGRLFTIEVKSAKGRLSEKQIEWMNKLEALGVITIVARDVQAVKDGLKYHDKPYFI